MKNLVSISQEELKNARNDIDKLGLAMHFGGEIAGIYYTIIKGMFIPFAANPNNSLSPNLKSIVIGLGIYVITQPLAFFLKGISLDKQENYRLAEYFNKTASEQSRKNVIRRLFAWGDRKFSDLHNYFANNSDNYERLLEKYILVKRRL